jgi:hypothetical protein
MQRIDVTIRKLKHRPTGLYVAVSDTPEMEGLYVAAHSKTELDEWVPTAIMQLLEAQGYEVVRDGDDDLEVLAGGWENEGTTSANFAVREVA